MPNALRTALGILILFARQGGPAGSMSPVGIAPLPRDRFASVRPRSHCVGRSCISDLGSWSPSG